MVLYHSKNIRMIESGATRSLSFVKTFFMKGYIEWQKN